MGRWLAIYFGVLAPNSPLRAAVTALVLPVATLAAAAPPLSVGFRSFLRPLRADGHVSNGSRPCGNAKLA